MLKKKGNNPGTFSPHWDLEVGTYPLAVWISQPLCRWCQRWCSLWRLHHHGRSRSRRCCLISTVHPASKETWATFLSPPLIPSSARRRSMVRTGPMSWSSTSSIKMSCCSNTSMPIIAAPVAKKSALRRIFIAAASTGRQGLECSALKKVRKSKIRPYDWLRALRKC